MGERNHALLGRFRRRPFGGSIGPSTDTPDGSTGTKRQPGATVAAAWRGLRGDRIGHGSGTKRGLECEIRCETEGLDIVGKIGLCYFTGSILQH